MVGRRLAVAGAMTVAALAVAPGAQARTIGSAAIPGMSSPSGCFGSPTTALYQAGGESPSYTASNGGTLTSWSVNVTGATPGAPIQLVVLRPEGDHLTVVAVDSRTVPATPPAGGIATFTLATPLALQPGDKFARGGASTDVACYFSGGSVAAEQILAVGEASPGLSAGATVTPSGPGTSPPGYQLNLAAEVTEENDIKVTTVAGPANAVAGGLAQLSTSVKNAGVASAAVTVKDTVPAGLAIVSAVAGGGTCTVAGQVVTCSIPSLGAGAAAPVVVLVTPQAAGSYANAVTATAANEVTPVDNSATATLTVAPAAGPVNEAACVVPRLKRTPKGVARGLLKQLDCKVAKKATRKVSRKVPKGAVIRTKPGRGEYAEGTRIKLVVSSGKPDKG